MFLRERIHTILIEVRSSIEFGSLNTFKVFKGYIGHSEEVLFSEKDLKCFNISREFLFEVDQNNYIRAEVWTSPVDANDCQSHFCITNPIWFSRD